MSWYNNSVKVEFINQYQGIVGGNVFNNIFQRCADMEFALEKDCSSFNLEEIMDLARSFHSADLTSVKVKMSLLRSYTQFCIEKGMSNTGLNHYSEITTAMYEGVVDRRKMAETYITREEVEEIIAAFENPRDKYIILAPYEGIYGPKLCEITELRKKDLLGNNRIRLCTGREIIVSDLLYGIMEEAAEEYEATYINRKVRLQNTDKIYKGIDKDSVGNTDDKTLKRKYWRMRSYLERSTFGARMLYVSGFINEIGNAVEKSGGFDSATREIGEIRKHYNSTYSIYTIKKMYKEAKFAKES